MESTEHLDAVFVPDRMSRSERERLLSLWRENPEPIAELVREIRVTLVPVAAAVWPFERVPAFAMRRPLDLVLEGRAAEVLAALRSLNLGTFS